MISIIWHLTHSKWAAAFPKFILEGAASCWHYVNKNPEHQLPQTGFEPTVICVPGDDSLSDYDFLNGCARRYSKVIWCVFSDEAGLFDVSRLEHPNQKIWAFAPQFPIHKSITTAAPFGWPTDCPDMVRSDGYRPFGWFFSGQVTHKRREECVANLPPNMRGICIATKGFAQGLPRQEYYDIMGRSKFVLCPGGPCTADSFRFAEALEAGAIPIVDQFPGEREWPAGYWNALFGEHLNFPVIDDWQALDHVIHEWSQDYEAKRDRCMRWWAAYKNGLIERMVDDLK